MRPLDGKQTKVDNPKQVIKKDLARSVRRIVISTCAFLLPSKSIALLSVSFLSKEKMRNCNVEIGLDMTEMCRKGYDTP